MSQEKFNLTWRTYTDHLREMLHDMMSSSELTDVTLVSDDQKKYKAHKVVLSASSSVFKSIISDTIFSRPIIYLRGIQSFEIESILQFIYLGEATFYQERMNEFINVAKNLEVKEISKDVDCNATDTSQNFNEDIESNEEVKVEKDQTKDENYILEQTGQTETKLRRYENGKFQHSSLTQHDPSTHERIRYHCDRCEKSYSKNQDLLRHIKSMHEGEKFQCNLCDSEYAHVQGLHRHKRTKH